MVEPNIYLRGCETNREVEKTTTMQLNILLFSLDLEIWDPQMDPTINLRAIQVVND